MAFCDETSRFRAVVAQAGAGNSEEAPHSRRSKVAMRCGWGSDAVPFVARSDPADTAALLEMVTSP